MDNTSAIFLFNNTNSNNKKNKRIHHRFSHSGPQQYIKTSMARHILYYFVIVTCITSQILSVNAIRCHQCNSHIDENCITLHSNGQLNNNDKYLKECTDDLHNKQAFCRKTVLKIEVNGEQRVIRSCGWMYDRAYMAKNSCFSADNEGYTQIICACHEDGCNGGNNLMNSLTIQGIALSSIMISVFFSNNFFLRL